MLHLNKKFIFLKSLFLVFIFSFLFFFIPKVQAANLYFNPSSGNYNVGDVIHVSVLVNTQGAPINSVEANINFPSNLLDVISVSKSNSFLTFWVQEPTFSNIDGTISLSGGLATPGFNGSDGKVLDVAFRIKKAGTAPISFASGAVRANDGLGTNVLKNLNQASFSLNEKIENAPPVIKESTVSKISNPKIQENKKTSVIENGALEIEEIPREDLTSPQVKFIFSATNTSSKIDHYVIQIDQKAPEIWKDDGTHIYQTTSLDPGEHLIFVKAYYQSDNFFSNSAEFIVEPLRSPTITDYPKELETSDILILRGRTYSSSRVNIYLQKDKDEPKFYTVQSNQSGEFVFVSDSSFPDGVYKAWVEVSDSREAKSLPSDKVTIIIKKSPFIKFGASINNFLYTAISLIALISLLILLVLFFWHKFLVLRRKIRKEVHNTERYIHRAFNLLKEDVSEQINMLKKVKTERKLTKEEEKIIKQFSKNLDVTENIIQKEIETIEKEVE